MRSDICRSAYKSLAPAPAADIQPELLVLCGVHGPNLFVLCNDRLQARNFKLESEGETAASVLRPKKRKAEGEHDNHPKIKKQQFEIQVCCGRVLECLILAQS
ncbi:hypothetical protein NDU88_005508 [Pleurodeles waltl]|uniref:Uncharacterized protein n=1 Tax=Pleurodeles waltl TaxID=8319 RepID=A0AAV7W814_PLEWA|nr:hypothetical protein NDU88_005508 [Pleurodeles waltl]